MGAPQRPLVFIGPMGAGKTKIGRGVARALRRPFVDTDRRVTAEHGPITTIFAESGEERFRVLEREAVARALGEKAVVSLGGGAVLHPDTQADLAGATVVFLTVSTAAVRARLRGSRRPLLTDGFEQWQQIFDQRRPLYEALAGIRIDTSDRSIESIVDEIVTWVRESND